MRKIISVIFLSLFAVLAFSFGGKAEDTKTSIVGHIKFYGNAPVEFAGFETVDGLVYTLKVAEDAKTTLKEIESQQGCLLELTGEVAKDVKKMPDVLKDGVFIVTDWKKL